MSTIKQTLNSILTGMARIFDVTGSLNSYEDILKRSDTDALKSDFKAVGGYIKTAMRKYEEEET